MNRFVQMWRRIEGRFRRKKARIELAKKMLELGLRAGKDGIYIDDVKIPDLAVARALGIDRRVVKYTVKQILEDPLLASIFTRLRPAGPDLSSIADALGYSVLEIRADPYRYGIVASVSGILAKHGIVIRQILSDDPDLTPDPKLTVVVEGKVPAGVLKEIGSSGVVKSVTLKL